MAGCTEICRSYCCQFLGGCDQQVGFDAHVLRELDHVACLEGDPDSCSSIDDCVNGAGEETVPSERNRRIVVMDRLRQVSQSFRAQVAETGACHDRLGLRLRLVLFLLEV